MELLGGGLLSGLLLALTSLAVAAERAAHVEGQRHSAVNGEGRNDDGHNGSEQAVGGLDGEVDGGLGHCKLLGCGFIRGDEIHAKKYKARGGVSLMQTNFSNCLVLHSGQGFLLHMRISDSGFSPNSFSLGGMKNTRKAITREKPKPRVRGLRLVGKNLPLDEDSITDLFDFDSGRSGGGHGGPSG
jgi:hypothetical protein